MRWCKLCKFNQIFIIYFYTKCAIDTLIHTVSIVYKRLEIYIEISTPSSSSNIKCLFYLFLLFANEIHSLNTICWQLEQVMSYWLRRIKLKRRICRYITHVKILLQILYSKLHPIMTALNFKMKFFSWERIWYFQRNYAIRFSLNFCTWTKYCWIVWCHIIFILIDFVR